MTERLELQNVIDLASRKPASDAILSNAGGGGTFDGMSERVGKLEVRADGIDRRLDGFDVKLDRIDSSLRDIAVAVARLPSKEFLITAILAVVGISLALAVAIAALTFNVADYASKSAAQAEQAKAGPPSASQPIVITLPAPTTPAAAPPTPPPSPAPPASQQR